MPYTDVATIDQPYATQVENVNGQLFYTWVGDMKLTPSGDEWFETELLPTITINREGNFDQILQQAGGEDALGTVWNAWETAWSTSGGTINEINRGARRQNIFEAHKMHLYQRLNQAGFSHSSVTLIYFMTSLMLFPICSSNFFVNSRDT